ncbi:MAG TPA: FAD-binding oxidoreductase, partial [Candidatus Baltobacteraceae bacterium]|nr:FAD-binding oxidoreductase [Candidatus Baltobacteraceae bacterium]
MQSEHAAALTAILGDASRVLTQPQVVEQLSRDFYWYSPVLRKQLDGKVGDLVVQPLSTGEIQNILRYCHAHDLPVTIRGAGTGNYGQAVPLRGGIVLDLARMDQIEAIQPDGVAVCQPGTRLGVLENEARKSGWELRCYPSTIIKATVGGFLGGGSGGIGSVAHGNLRDFDTVRALEVVTMEAEPRLVLHEGAAVHEILHAWGTNGVITRIWLALAPAVEWAQCAVAFDTFDAAYDFSERIAKSPAWTKRLVTTFEWPISSFFAPVRQYAPDGKALIFFMIAAGQLPAFEGAARESGGEISYSGAYLGLRTRPLLSDYTWNHTTLWAMKTDDAYTYLQCAFDPARVR